MPIRHIYELFVLDGQAFVTESYRNLLNREPDEHGMAYYLGRLAAGYGKARIIMQLAESKESRPHHEIIGLEKLIKAEKHMDHWLWGKFGRWQRQEMLLREGIQGLMRVNLRMGEMNSTLCLLPQRLDALAERMELLQTSFISKQVPAAPTPTLSADDVRAAFLEILGREPENNRVIAEHSNHESIEVLRRNILESEEFKSHVAALPEYARSIFNRMQLLQQGI
jgi:hypothetical protein